MYDQKRLFSLAESEIVFLHLNARNTIATKDFFVQSTLPIVVGEARHAINNIYSKNILPCLGAFAALDQVGTAYSSTALAPYSDPKGSGIKKALYYFAGFTENGPETKALYLFRNGIVHDGSLVAHTPNGKLHQWCSYDDSIPDAVQLPKTAWDGTDTNLTDDTVTLINPQKLLELAEKVLSSVERANAAGQLNINLAGGAQEVIFRYFLLKPRQGASSASNSAH